MENNQHTVRQEDRETMYRMKAAGRTHSDIAATIGRHPDTIRKYLKRHPTPRLPLIHAGYGPWTEALWHSATWLLLEDGLPTSKAAAILGVTKNSLISKIQRMWGPGWRPGTKESWTPFTQRMDALDRMAPEKSRCQFPIGHPGHPDFHYCNGEADRSGLCEKHRKRCYYRLPEPLPEIPTDFRYGRARTVQKEAA